MSASSSNSNKVIGPVKIPTSAWHQDDLCRALEARDVAAVLRLVQRYGDVSQVRLANITGISQGRINEIVDGRCQVTALELFERIGNGLSMPDEARLRVYHDLPTWRVIRLDSALYLSAFGTWSECHRSGMYKLTAAANGVLHAGFVRHFEDVWQRSGPVQEARS